MKKLTFVLVVLLIGAALWIIDLRRRLHSSQMRGDMYRDISARLDRRLVEQTEPSEHP
jgi:hypothetical protein